MELSSDTIAQPAIPDLEPPRAPMFAERRAQADSIGVTMLDLDRTLTRRGTYTPFLLRSARRIAPYRLVLVPAVVGCMLAYRMSLIDRVTLKQLMLRLLLGPELSVAKTNLLASAFADHVVRHGLHAEALPLIARELREGRLLILATAAHRFYAEAIARRLGISEVVATESRRVGGRFVPEITGGNCYGPRKAEAVRERLRTLGLARDALHLRVYSDDISDTPCFEEGDECFVVNPSSKLAKLAAARAWSILRFR
jgi:HAD superfamily phosphoserine phosphatase-like hydrolase